MQNRPKTRSNSPPAEILDREVDKSALRIGRDQLYSHAIAHVESLLRAGLANIHQHALHVWIKRPHKRSVLIHASHDRREALPNPRMQHYGRDPLLHIALHLARRV